MSLLPIRKPSKLKPAENLNFICDCDNSSRSACTKELFYKELEGKRYCVLHFPSKEKSKDFNKALQRKFDDNDFNFCGVWFPADPMFSYKHFTTKADFSNAVFLEDVSFIGTIFDDGANFAFTNFKARACFRATTFHGIADFNSVNFDNEADFISASFNASAFFYIANFNANVLFNTTIFKSEADFSLTTFNAEVDFKSASFNGVVEFYSSTFKDYVSFAPSFRFAKDEEATGFSSSSAVNFQYARIEKPNCVSFHTLALHPYWFVNVDARMFSFTNVKWCGSISQEIQALQNKNTFPSNLLLAIASRQLAINAEENHRYEEASKFRYWSMDAQRREAGHHFAFWRLEWWYWAASGYGERILRAFLMLAGIWLFSTLLYTQVGFLRWEPIAMSENDLSVSVQDEAGKPLNLKQAVTYSLGVMSLQKPEPRPATNMARTLVTLEMIFGPIQAALLALAIRRKFMR